MIRSVHTKLGLPVYVIYPGDHYVTRENCVLNTITGSCVVVCLHDKTLGIGGMGHFIIPGMIGTEGIISSEIAEHGIVNLEYLMAEIVKSGGDRKRLTAKIFGAAFSPSVNMSISNSNIRFLHDYFAFEKIPIDKEELGGKVRREIIFNPKTGEVYRKVLAHNKASSEFMRLENEYIERTFRDKEIKTHVVLFD